MDASKKKSQETNNGAGIAAETNTAEAADAVVANGSATSDGHSDNGDHILTTATAALPPAPSAPSSTTSISDLRSPLRRVSQATAGHTEQTVTAETVENQADDANREDKLASGKDFYCWQCHKEKVNVECFRCSRSYHYKCLPSSSSSLNNSASEGTLDVSVSQTGEEYVCLECKNISRSEQERISSPMLGRVSEEDFCTLLKFALQTIKQTADATFHQPVTEASFPDYREFVVYPMDFLTIDRNIRKKQYKSTEGLLADVKWIVHNSYVYNSHSHQLTKNAQYFLKVAKNEMAEIEVCPDCFMNFYVYPKTWFTETCHKPHGLVWARLKGHPFWPAKAVRVDLAKKEVDCRFFGAHDRAWVPFDSCFQLSEAYAWSKPKGHKSKLDSALSELKEHLNKLSDKFPGAFCYSEPKTPFNPNNTFLKSKSSEKEEEADDDEEEAALTIMNEDDENEDDEKPLVISTTSNSPQKKAPEQVQRVASKRKSSTAMKSTPSKSLKANSSDTDNSPSKAQGAAKVSTPSDKVISQSGGNKPATSSTSKRQQQQKVSEEPVPVAAASKSTIHPSPKAAAVTSAGSRSSNISKQTKLVSGQATRPASSGKSSISSTSSTDSGAGGKRSRAKAAEESASVPANNGNVTVVTPGTTASSNAAGAPAPTKAGGDVPSQLVKSLRDEIAGLKKQLASQKAAHITEVTKIKENAERSLASMREEKETAAAAVVAKLTEKHKKEIEETKTKQWCAACLKEAIYFCCWNCSYCGYDCQSSHWPQHMAVCQQQNKTQQQSSGSSSGTEGRATTAAAPGSGATASESQSSSALAGPGAAV